MGDRIVVMKDGVIQQVATPLELYDRPINQFVAGFIGSPPMNFFEGRIEQQNGVMQFQEGGFTLQVEASQASRLSDYAGKDVVFGVRPEDIRDVAHVTNPNPHHQLTAKVEVVEPMGSEIFLYLTTGKHTFTARVSARASAAVNQDLNLVLTMEKAHFFDKSTGEILV